MAAINKITHKNGYLLAFALMLILTLFFDIIVLPAKYFRPVGIVILLYFFINSKMDKYRNKMWIGIIWLMIMGSVGYSYFVNRQSPLHVTIASYFAMGLCSFCVFSSLNLSAKDSLRLTRNFSILFCVCYILQWIVYPVNIFAGSLDEFSIGETYFRMRMACSICSYCLLFLGITDLMSLHKMRGVICCSLGFIPIIIMGFRSLVTLTVVFTIYLIVAYNKSSKKNLVLYAVFLGLLALLSLQVPLVQEKIEEMNRRQETDQTFENSDYVRYFSLAYYQEVYDTPTERLIGGGVPLVPKSLHSNNHYVSQVCNGYSNKLYWNDLGLIGFGFLFGFPSVILISFLIFRTIYRSKDKTLLFIRSTLLTTYLGTIFTSQELYRSGNFIFIGLLMYVEYRYHIENRKNENRNTYISQRI